MLRFLYTGLLRLHPSAFRQRFGDEMLEIYDVATGVRATCLLFADVLLSLIRQWLLRPEFRRQPRLAPAVKGGESMDVPHFRTLDSYKPRTATLLQGSIATTIILSVALGMIGKGESPRSLVFGVSRSSVSGSPPVAKASRVGGENKTEAAKAYREQEASAEYFETVRLLKALDTDGSLSISQHEIDDAAKTLRTLDTNRDGKLSPDEWGAFVEMKAEVSPEFARRSLVEFIRANPVLATLNADRNGIITAQDLDNSSAALKKLDRNQDGSLTADELLPPLPDSQVAFLMLTLDLNDDGVISQPERQGKVLGPQLGEMLQAADRNRDGLITRKELLTEIVQRRDAACARRPCSPR